MRIHRKPVFVAMSLLLGAGLALGLNAANKSAGPTRNDFRLRVTIDNVPAGRERLVIEAMGSSGEVVDRKEINVDGVPRGQSFFVVLSQGVRRGQRP